MSPERAGVEALVDDLVNEQSELDAVVNGIDGTSWDLPTPAEGWMVRDQISHLAFFDDAATEALVRPDSFSAIAKAAMEQPGDPMEAHLTRGREMSPQELLDWWRTSRTELVNAATAKVPGDKVPWYGPPMGLMSFLSARLMESWAHGRDVADALGVYLPPTDRLRHIAHLGVRTRGFSYLVRGLEPPPGPVHVELSSPSGERWAWDEPGAAGAPEASVRGTALDFCLVVTQRRNVLDTSLEIDGEVARKWLQIAQAFAGPPGRGRSPSKE